MAGPVFSADFPLSFFMAAAAIFGGWWVYL